MRIILRPIELKDGDNIVKWRNDKSVLSHCMSKNPITIELNTIFFNENILTGKYKQFIVECINDDYGVVAYPIATVYLKDMDCGNKKCELCIFTSSDHEWIDESQSIAVRMLLNKAFVEYSMHKVYSYVFSRFSEEITLLEKAGFKVEAVLEDEAINEDGEFQDVIRLCAFNSHLLSK